MYDLNTVLLIFNRQYTFPMTKTAVDTFFMSPDNFVLSKNLHVLRVIAPLQLLGFLKLGTFFRRFLSLGLVIIIRRSPVTM